MMRRITKYLHTLLLLVIAGMLGAILMRMSLNPGPVIPNNAPVRQADATEELTVTATETIPPYTPLPSLTPSRTLKPPPTFEPPTATVPPTLTPTITPT